MKSSRSSALGARQLIMQQIGIALLVIALIINPSLPGWGWVLYVGVAIWEILIIAEFCAYLKKRALARRS